MLQTCDVEDAGVGEVEVEVEDCVVGTTTTSVDDAALDADADVEVDGCT